MDSTPAASLSSNFWIRVVVKAGLLFLALNLLWALFDPMPALGKLSICRWPTT